MIISVRDSRKLSSDAAGLTAVLASMTSIAKSKKTLVMQFTPCEEESVLNYLYGKRLADQELSALYRRFDDDGLDALFIRAESTDLVAEHFDECVTPVFEKTNLLDVLKPTKQLDHKKIMDLSKISGILKSAEEVYDFIFCMIPFEDSEICEVIAKHAHASLVCIPQSPEMVKLSANDIPVVMDFEESSKFDIKYLKKRYRKNIMYLMPHNVEYRDSMLTKTVLDFMLKNKKDMKEDVNYVFVSSLMVLITKFITGQEKIKEIRQEMKVIKKEQQMKVKSVDKLNRLEENAVQEVIVKSGLFGKKKTKIMIHLDSNPNSNPK